ncbi:MAG: hypothetical protein Q7S74_04465 [Nanoarchaeota archaeon]|nr:hypothetical protein [Nanoarchaeota archaeon]
MTFSFDSTFIDKWQTLIGSALGPFLAVILSVIGFRIKSVLEKREEKKEYLRRVEVGITSSLNDIYTVREQLQWFSNRLHKLAAETKSHKNTREFFLSTVNFPAIREIYNDPDMMAFKVKSYYLHNKILFASAGIKQTNETTHNLKNDFDSILRQNELLVALLSRKPPSESADNITKIQRETYSENLENFAKAIDEYITQGIQLGIRALTQTKIYNDLLRKKWGWFALWRQEGTSLKYFKNKENHQKFSRNLDSMDRIDAFIEVEVQALAAKAEARKNKISIANK